MIKHRNTPVFTFFPTRNPECKKTDLRLLRNILTREKGFYNFTEIKTRKGPETEFNDLERSLNYLNHRSTLKIHDDSNR